MTLRIAATLSITALVFFCGQPKSLAGQWIDVEEGAELLRQQLRPNVSMIFLRVSLDRFDVRVATPQIPTFDGSKEKARPSSDVEQYTPERKPKGFFLEDYINRYVALAAISASYVETFSPPTPLGQIKSSGRVIGMPHFSWATEGVFCSDEGRVLIENATRPLADMNYRDCLQVGPILLQQSAVPAGLQNADGKGSDYDKIVSGQVGHSVVCIDGAGKVLLGLIGKIPLSQMVTALRQLPLNCVDAIRLQPGGMQVKSDLFGTDKYLHPSALVVLDNNRH
jgi:hypothetical protein